MNLVLPASRVRPAVIDDVPALTEIYNHYVDTSAATFDIEPLSVEARRDWFHHYDRVGRHRLVVAEREGRVIGYASSSRFRDKAAYLTSVETSVYVHADARGHGVGVQLYSALFEALAGEDIHRAYAGVALPNPASVKLHRRFGFREIGTYREVGRKFDRYWDVQWFEKVLPG